MSVLVAPSNHSTRCLHGMLVGQCALCAEGKARKAAASNPGVRASRPRVRRLVAALAAQRAGSGGTTSARKALAGEVREAEASLNTADRRLARRIADERQVHPTRAQLVREDKLAGIHMPWVTSQNVGRGRRS